MYKWYYTEYTDVILVIRRTPVPPPWLGLRGAVKAGGPGGAALRNAYLGVNNIFTEEKCHKIQ